MIEALRGALAATVEGGPRCRVLVGGEVASAGVPGRFLTKMDRRRPDRQDSHALMAINEGKKGVRTENGDDFTSSEAGEERGWRSSKNGSYTPLSFFDAIRVERHHHAHPRTPLTTAVNTSHRWL